MPFSATPVFMVKQVNFREVTVPGEPCPAHPEGCSRSEGRTENRFDVVRVDTGQIVVPDCGWMGWRLPAGAMYWEEISNPAKPSGPDDWDGYDDEHLDRIRQSFAAHPQYYRPSPTPEGERPERLRGLPARQPSHIFVDGPQLMVICPNGSPWNIDSRASNCTMPYDYSHRCWVRTGTPPKVTVDKGGHTCAAGAGSIMAYGPRDVGDYHGVPTRRRPVRRMRRGLVAYRPTNRVARAQRQQRRLRLPRLNSTWPPPSGGGFCRV